MALHPHKSMTAILEALARSGPGGVLFGMGIFMSYDGNGWSWSRIITSNMALIVALPVGLASLIAYVRAGRS